MNATATTTAPATISSKAIIRIEAAESFLQVSWTSAPTPSEVAACADYLSTIIQQNGITQLLHDVRLVDYGNIELQRCLTHVFCPQVLAAGTTKIVHLANYVLPDLLVIDQIMDGVKRRYVTDRTTKLEICTTLEGAIEWFQNNTFRKSAAISQKQEEVKAAAFSKVSRVNTLLNTYKEKIAWIGKIVFTPQALFADL